MSKGNVFHLKNVPEGAYNGKKKAFFGIFFDKTLVY